MDTAVFRKKVLGGWLGKAVGGTLGQPWEGAGGPLNLSFYDPVPTEMMPNDDLDLQILWACRLASDWNGIISLRNFEDAWLNNVAFPFDEYGVAIRNLRRGIHAPYSGKYDNWFTDGLGAAIRSELWACVAPGNPTLAAKYANADACVDHHGNGVNIAQRGCRVSVKTIVILFALSAIPLFAAESDLEKAVAFRKTEQFGKAERLLKKYSSPANFDSLKSTEKIEFLRGLLELAHIRALKDDVTGSLALLNWAEGRSDPYQRAIACVKYAEILLDMGEFERASAYLKNADEVIKNRATEEDTGAAIGQGGTIADTGAVWRDLRDDADVLKAEIETETLKKKFGASYGNYVKLRRLQVLLKRSRTPRYMKEAMKLADELIGTDPASQFAAAAGYLKGEIMASRLKEESPKKEIKEVKDYLEKFVKQQPDGIYRGEALMLLGKISLEVEWNAKDAEKYYSQALDWFRKAREKRDAVSLYAAMNDDLKQQSAPTQKPTTLNQWKRIVYHDEDPLKLYNTANAPVWYINDKEKNCLFNLGLIKFLNGKFEEAGKLWEQGGKLDDTIMLLQAEDFPNTLQRISTASKQGFFVTDSLEHKSLSDQEKLFVMLSEFCFLEEKFEQSLKLWKALQIRPKISSTCRAIAIMGEADCLRMLPNCNTQYIASLYNRVVSNKIFSQTALRARAMYNLAWITLQSNSKNHLQANQLFEQCIQEHPKTKYAEASLFYLIVINIHLNTNLAKKYTNQYRAKYPDGIYKARIDERLKQTKYRKATNNEK